MSKTMKKGERQSACGFTESVWEKCISKVAALEAKAEKSRRPA